MEKLYIPVTVNISKMVGNNNISLLSTMAYCGIDTIKDGLKLDINDISSIIEMIDKPELHLVAASLKESLGIDNQVLYNVSIRNNSCGTIFLSGIV
jgi:GTP-sensing pleiotropic transcriptional regulator CodY